MLMIDRIRKDNKGYVDCAVPMRALGIENALGLVPASSFPHTASTHCTHPLNQLLISSKQASGCAVSGNGQQ